MPGLLASSWCMAWTGKRPFIGLPQLFSLHIPTIKFTIQLDFSDWRDLKTKCNLPVSWVRNLALIYCWFVQLLFNNILGLFQGRDGFQIYLLMIDNLLVTVRLHWLLLVSTACVQLFGLK